MTITTTATSVTYSGNSATTVFAFPFLVPAADDLVVTKTQGGSSTVIPQGLYTATGFGNATGGSITYNPSGTPLPTGATITLERVLPFVQQTNLINQGGYYPHVVENQLDYLTMLCQQINGIAFGSNVPLSELASSTEGFGADLIPNTVKRVADVTAARAITVATTVSIIFIASFDGGFFKRDSTDTSSAENGGSYCGTIIRSTDYATNGVWKRVFSGPYFSAWYGILASNSAATNQSLISTAITAINALGGGSLLFPIGTTSHQGITAQSNVRLVGLDRVKTILLNTNNAVGITFNNVSGHGLDGLTVSQSGNANSVDAISMTDCSNADFGDVGIDTPGRYGLSFLGGAVSGCFNNTFQHLDIIGLSASKRGVYFQKNTNRNNANKILGGRCNNGDYGVYMDTDSGLANEFGWTVQSQIIDSYYINAGNNKVYGYIEPASGANAVELGSSGGQLFFAPSVCNVSGGGVALLTPAAPNAGGPTYTFIPPTGLGLSARFQNFNCHTLTSDVGAGTGTGKAVLTLKNVYANYTTSGTSEETAVSYTLPASSLTGTGDSIRIRAWGTTNNAAAAKTIVTYFGETGTRTVSSVTSSTAAVLPWVVEAVVQRTGASSQSSFSRSTMGAASVDAIDERTASPNQTLASDVVVSVGLTAAAGATVTLLGCQIEYLPST